MKKAMKICTALLLVCALGLVLTACNDTDGSNSSNTVTLWLPTFGVGETLDEELWAPVIRSFEEAHNAKVEFTAVPWDGYEEKYLTAVAGNTGPDVGYMYVEMFPSFISMGAVMDVNPFFTQAERDVFVNWNAGQLMGGQYGVPFASGDPRVLLYNEAILRELGEEAPVTWEDFRRIAIAATAEGWWGYSTSFADAHYGSLPAIFYPFLWQAGGDIYNEAGDRVIINSPEAIRATQFIYDLIHVDGVVPPDWSSANLLEMFLTHFATGNAAFALVPSSMADQHLGEYPDLEWSFVTALQDRTAMTFAPTDFLVLMSKAEGNELAVELLKHFVSVEAVDRIQEFHSFVTPRRDAPYFGSEAFARAFEEDGHKMRPLNASLEAIVVYDYLMRQMQLIMNNQVSVADGLADVENFGNAAIEDFLARNEN